ncbi:MAG: GNAT family N-acetyltransferase [Crocinitomicaceae bacterium]
MSYLDLPPSERLVYAPLDENYARMWIPFLSDESAMRYFPKLNISPEERARQWIDSQLERYRNGTYGMYALHLKKTNDFIGQCGLLKQEVDGKQEVEIGYHLLPQYWGNGYATEAAKHFKKNAFQQQMADSLISIIHKDNLLSQAVAKRNGMHKDFQTNWKGMEVIVFRTRK